MVEARLVVTALAMMLAMFLAGLHGLRHRTGIAILALLSLAWFTIDKLFEGDVVVQLSSTHAVTASDFVGLLGLVVAALLWWRTRRVVDDRDAASSSGDRHRVPARPGGIADKNV